MNFATPSRGVVEYEVVKDEIKVDKSPDSSLVKVESNALVKKGYYIPVLRFSFEASMIGLIMSMCLWNFHWSVFSLILCFCLGLKLHKPKPSYKTFKELIDKNDIKGMNQLLLIENVDVNVTGGIGWTPLLHACRCGAEQMIQPLLDAGASIKAKHWTPLHLASRYGTEQMIQPLLDAGDNVNAVNCDGETPLHLVCRYGTEQMVKILLGAGADVYAKDNFDRTVLHFASNEKKVQLLLDAGGDAIPKNRGRLLHYALKKDYESIVIPLLDGDVNINVKGEKGCTCLHFACEKDNIKIIKLLLDLGADITVRNHRYKCPFDLAGPTTRYIFDDYLKEKGKEICAELMEKEGEENENG